MKRSDIDFGYILSAMETLQRISNLESYSDLSRAYFLIDPQIRTCLINHQGMHRGIKRVDFMPLTLRDLTCEDYVRNRMKKMLNTLDLLMSFDKTYSKALYNKSVEMKKLSVEY